MNITDLRDVFDERSTVDTDEVMHHLRLAGVRGRVRSRRRRRLTAWAVATFVMLAGVDAVAVQLAPFSRERDNLVAAPSTIKGFPEYALGARVVAAEVADLPAKRIEVTVTARTAALTLFTRCQSAPDTTIEVEVSFLGSALTWGGCGGAYEPANLAERGLRTGVAETFVMTVTGGTARSGRFGLAVGEAVPFADYPFPPRPATLRALDGPAPAECTIDALCDRPTVVRSDPDDPLRPRQQTVPAVTVTGIELVSQTPGLLHVTVDGKLVGTGKWWDYEAGTYGISVPATGQAGELTIEIVPEHVTGAWKAVVQTGP